jgi:hypothetical protein
VASHILQRFLYAGLLDIGDDDERLDRLLKASAALEAKLFATPRQVARAVVVACDATTPPDDPLFAWVHEAVATEWSTYRNRVSSQPQQLYRAVLLEALARGAVRDDASAAVLSLVGSNWIPRAVAPEQDVLRQAITELAFDRYEKLARSAWNPGGAAEPPAKPTQRAPAVNEKRLGEELNAAAYPNNAQGQAFGGTPNPHSPHNQPQGWAAEFSTRAASAVARAVAEPIGKLHGELQASAEQAGRRLSRTVAALRMQNDILWWKSAAYSASAGVSYRDLAPAVVAVAVPLDLQDVVPGFTPRVLEYVMLELLRDVVRDFGEKKLATAEVADALAGGVVGTGLRAALEGFGAGVVQGRTLLAHELVLRAERADESRMPRTGISANEKFQLGDFAVWLFRELQGLQLSSKCTAPAPVPEAEPAGKKGAASAKDAGAA